MSLSVITPPTAEPLTLAEVRAHLRIDSSDQDSTLAAYLAAARGLVEVHTRRALMTQTMRLTLDCFDDWAIQIPVAPVQSITSIVYRDYAGTTTTLDDVLYRVDLYSEPCRITPSYSLTWPTTRGETGDVTITFVAGYASADDVPAEAKLAINQLIGTWFENRENVNVGNITSEMPWTVAPLLSSICWGAYP